MSHFEKAATTQRDNIPACLVALSDFLALTPADTAIVLMLAKNDGYHNLGMIQYGSAIELGALAEVFESILSGAMLNSIARDDQTAGDAIQ